MASLWGEKLMDDGKYVVRVRGVDTENKKVVLDIVENQGEGKPVQVRLTYKKEIEDELVEGTEISVEIEGDVVTRTV
jgi:hypothetical protein